MPSELITHGYRLFPLPRQEIAGSIDSSLHPPVPSIYMPGNHDLGLHLESDSLTSWERERFEAAFGPPQGQKDWGGWDVVWVDSMALLEQAPAGQQAKSWVERVGKRESLLHIDSMSLRANLRLKGKLTKPRALFTHIPLYRPEGTSCGKARESTRSIRQGAGKNYQNELDEATTKWLVEALKPTIVFRWVRFGGLPHSQLSTYTTLKRRRPRLLCRQSPFLRAGLGQPSCRDNGQSVCKGGLRDGSVGRC